MIVDVAEHGIPIAILDYDACKQLPVTEEQFLIPSETWLQIV
ncbi:MAG: hypothetical protein AB7P49_04365 [Bdellovibrionales bacterium]